MYKWIFEVNEPVFIITFLESGNEVEKDSILSYLNMLNLNNNNIKRNIVNVV